VREGKGIVELRSLVYVDMDYRHNLTQTLDFMPESTSQMLPGCVYPKKIPY